MGKSPSVRKILQALYYIQNHAPTDNEDRFNIVYLLKMLYFSDRYHLRHYGGLASHDTYYAMQLGPVASFTYDILKKTGRNMTPTEIEQLSYVKELDEHSVEIEAQGSEDLSTSFKKAMDFTLKEFGQFRWSKQSSLSHCYPEWKKHAHLLTRANPRILMDIRDFFDDVNDDKQLSALGKNGDPFKEDKEFLVLLRDGIDADTVPS
jgi:uncharacterized phage-associated protein